MTIGEKIREARLNAGLKQVQLAEMIGVNSVTISRWENGRSKPRAGELESLTNIFSTFKVGGDKESPIINAASELGKTLDPCAPSTMSHRAGELLFKNGDIEIRMPDNPENQKIFYHIVERMLDSLSVPAPKEETPASLPAPVGVSKSA